MKKLLFALLLFAAAQITCAQQPPFWQEIQQFKKEDSLASLEIHPIVFTGSSSFTFWKDVNKYFPGFLIMNRGFGGSSLLDVIRYADDVIVKYNPRQVVIYCGENDFASDSSLTAIEVTDRFMELFGIIRKKLSYTHIAYVSMKPSPSRTHLMAKFDSANLMIKDFIKKKENAAYIDVYHAMLNNDGSPMADIFLDDKLHMNTKGYVIWQKIMAPYLKK